MSRPCEAEVDDLICCVKGNDLSFYFYAEARKMLRATIAPFVVDAHKLAVVFHFTGVVFQVFQITAKRHVYAVRADKNTTFEAQLFAKRTLPKHHRFRIGDGYELIKQYDFLHM